MLNISAMKKSAIILVIMIFLPGLSCDEKDEVRVGPVEIKLSQEQIEIIDGTNRFGLDLFREVVDAEPASENLFISPLSVHLALSMTWNGADGNTRQQMMDVLNYPDHDDETINASIRKLIEDLLSVDKKVETGIANSIWYRDTWNIRQDFLDVNKKYFDARIGPLDFDNPASRDIINAWVAEMTNNRIEEIVDQIDVDHVMFLINAIYFKGVWTKEFVAENTRERPFYLSAGNQKEVMTMETEGEFGYAERDGYKVAELPYGQGNYSMLVFLPDQVLSADELIHKLDTDEWNTLPDMLASNQTVNIRLPRFTFEYDTDLDEALINLGMTDAFDELRADLTRIADPGSRNLYVSRVRHKSFVEVNEEGTEAAAVTSVEVSVTSFNPDAPQITNFHVNRPFVFAIKEKYTNSIIFIGRVMEP